MVNNQVVFVLGPYRSGTSVTSRVLAGLGVDFGAKRDMIPADPRNPSGYFERDDVNTINRRFIESAGGTLEAPVDPALCHQLGNLGILKECDLSWMQPPNIGGIKDPRMCATLHAWFEAGVFDSRRCRIVHVSRELEATVRSAISHEHVARYGGQDPIRIRHMIANYQQMASWQAQHAPCPVLNLRYEDLLSAPLQKTKELATFLEINQSARIRHAARNIGKQRAQSRLRLQAWWASFRFRAGAWRHALLGRQSGKP